MNENQKRGSFSGTLGFVLAAAGSAVGLGNIWRFPYLAAKNGGGLFLLVYVILALTFGFALLSTEIGIGRKTTQGPLTAYGKLHPKWGFTGILASLVPIIILPYYCVIGGWIIKYLIAFLNEDLLGTTADGYFGGFITSPVFPIVFFVIFLLFTSIVVYKGVNHGIERLSTVLMPILVVLMIGIGIFSLFQRHTDGGVTRTGLDGLKIYLIPNFEGLTFKKLLTVIFDAMGQLFFSISVAMGIMVAYGSYVPKKTNLIKSVNQIEIFDTVVAMLAGMMIIPTVFVFQGQDGLSAAGPSLLFVSMPKVFNAMGGIGSLIGIAFFVMVLFAAITSSVSIMEAIVASFMDKFKMTRQKATVVVTVIALVLGLIVCGGYSFYYFDLTLPNGSVGQVLDIFDYLSNNILMPLTAIFTCILVGWVAKPKSIIDEFSVNGEKFARRGLYIVMIKYVTPIMLVFLLLQQAFNFIK